MRLIVKVQTPIETNAQEPLALVYNEDRSYEELVPITPELREMMRGKPKLFFHARVDEALHLDSEAPWQSW
jgi:hypothetical protein